MNKPLVLVTAPIETRSGYGNHSRDICQALIEMDKYDVRIQSVRWGSTPPNALEKGNPIHQEIEKRILRQPSMEKQPDLHLHIVIPNEFQPIAKVNVGMTAGIEHTIPPGTWVEGCNRMDMTIFTSEFSRDCFKNVEFDKLDSNTKQVVSKLKLEKPTEVLFEGADTNIYKETKEISDNLKKQFSRIKEDFCFLFTGHWLSGNLGEDRKDIGMMLKVFYTMFKNQKNQPALILKTSGAGFSILDRNEMMKRIKMVKDSMNIEKLPPVYLLHGDLTDEEMNQMYNHPKVKAHLSFTHGEGFGRPLLEASFSGKPILAPIATGQADFLSKDYTVELPHSMTKVPGNAFPKDYGNPEAEWATVNYGIAGRLIKDVFENYDKYKLKAKKQMIVNRDAFSHQAMKDKLEGIMDKLLANVPQPVQLKLPTLKKEPKKLKLPTLKKG
jgi:glycosyltransferase involved in cell wall biosynthesis|tara:strand:+ start:277 stop:1596 length:1320 start_codon:yes stop_codon:yes gene_type:complete